MDILQNPAFNALLDDYLRQAENAFRKRANKANLKLTGAMVDSFQRGAVVQGTDFIKGKVEMVGYVRLKDIKRMQYTHYMPTDVLEYFVDKIGVENFAYVPGYDKPGAKLPSREAQAKRIVFGIQAYRHQHPEVRRKYASIYNDPIGKNIYPRLAFDIKQMAAKVAMEGVKEMIEGDV